ncbi:MAG: hypothetical protein SGILL_004229 [Bacillariaceae sp.]
MTRETQDAPGYSAKEILGSSSKGQKAYAESGTIRRAAAYAPPTERRDPAPTSESRRGRQQSPREAPTSADMTPQERIRAARAQARSRSKSISRKKANKDDQAASRRKTPKQEPLLNSKERAPSRSSKTSSKMQRLRSLKLRILATENEEQEEVHPVYQPPAEKELEADHEHKPSDFDYPESDDDVDSTIVDDKYSVTAAAGTTANAYPDASPDDEVEENEMKWEKRDDDEVVPQSVSAIIEEADEILMWRKDLAQSSFPSVPPLVRPVEQRIDHPLDSEDSDESDFDSVWTSRASMMSDEYAPVNEFKKEKRIDEKERKSEKVPLRGGENQDDVVDAPRKASHRETIRGQLSSGDVESGVFLGINGNSEDLYSGSEDGIVLLKQKVAYVCIALSAIQLALLFIQLTLCGMASLKINPMIGPYPDAFSEWGGKNAYLLVEKNQYFRIITPVLLHVGVIHLLINAYCQLETCAYFEREWGSKRWITIYLISGIGSVLASSAIDPDVIGVTSSGALMGMFGAKIAHVVTWNIFELKSSVLEESARFDDLGGVLCGAAMLSMLSFVTFIDWSGQAGGMVTGLLVGMVIFSKPIAKRSRRVIWSSLGILGLVTGAIILAKILLDVEQDEDLGDACQYFRTLYPEGYVCECVWDD